MTTLVMVQTPDDVIVGWDSAATNGQEQTTLVQPKAFVRDGVIYAVAGTLHAQDILQTMDLPFYDGSDPRLWIIKVWAPAVRAAMAEDGWLHSEDERPAFQVLITIDGTAFEIDRALSPTHTHEGIYTAGSGADYARGALFMLRNHGIELDENAVLEALIVASQTDSYTGGGLVACRASKYILTEAF